MCFKKFLSFITFKRKKTAPPPKIMAWANDCLGYKQVSSRFSAIVKTIDQSFTIISLEGYDGWGKTFF